MEWTYVAMYALTVLMVGAGLLGASAVLGPARYKDTKHDTYECGMPQLSNTRDRFSVKFYLVAIMFILFDIETVFLVPWALLYRELGPAGLVEVGIFFAVLGFGLVYLWKRGGLEWD